MLACRPVSAEAGDTEGASVEVVGADEYLGLSVRHALHLVAPLAHSAKRWQRRDNREGRSPPSAPSAGKLRLRVCLLLSCSASRWRVALTRALRTCL